MIALYCRVSTQEQASEGYSIGEQQERLKNYCAARAWKNFRVYVDAGYSGGSMNRPALQNMISDIKKGLIEAVVVYKLDRLSRSQKDSLVLIEDIFQKNNVDFISMSENFDTSSPFGRAMIGILSVFAQLEREQIKERMILGVEARAKTGKWCGSIAPIGYDYVDGLLQINDFEALQVREAYNLALKNKSFHSIAKKFNDCGYVSKYGDWYTTTVRRVLYNPVYTGQIVYSGTFHSGIHEPIISQELFDSVQVLLKQKYDRHKKINSNIGKSNSYLSGLLFCGCCGARYSKTLYKPKRKDNSGNYYIYDYYACNSRNKKNKSAIKDPNCKNKNWKREELDNLVFEEIRKMSLNKKYFNQQVSISDNSSEIDSLQKQIKKIDAQLEKAMDLYILSDISFEVIDEKTKELNDRRQKLEDQLEDLEASSKSINKDEIYSLIMDFDKILENGDFDQIHCSISRLIEKIVINGEVIDIYWAF